MNFGFDDEQAEIKSTARDFLASRFKPEVVRELAEEGRYDDALWKEICGLGWTGIAISEENGGQGLGMIELIILCEELGYACAPTPFLSNAAAGLALVHAGSDEQRSRWLEGSADGSGRGSVGFRSGDDQALVPDADEAEFIALLGDEDGTVLAGSEARSEALEAIDPTRRYARVSGEGEALPGDVSGARDRIAVAVAGELVGVAQRAMDMAVEYAKERQQFERPIGAYQAVSHACSQMLYDVEEARSLTYAAAWAADAEPETLPLAAAMAKARASDAAWDVCKASLQVHGGIGFTWEHDLHFLLKRARAGGQLFGAASGYRDRVAGLAGMA